MAEPSEDVAELHLVPLDGAVTVYALHKHVLILTYNLQIDRQFYRYPQMRVFIFLLNTSYTYNTNK